MNPFFAFLKLKTAHLLFEAGCTKFAVASVLYYGLFVLHYHLRPASKTVVMLHDVQIKRKVGNSMRPSELPN